MREIDLSRFNMRTDLIIDDFVNKDILSKINYRRTDISKDIVLEELEIDSSSAKLCGKMPGIYKNISFKDITDTTNFNKVNETFTNTLISFFNDINIKENDSVLVVGLGNIKSTPDALGPKTVEKIIVTHHILKLGSLENGYRDTSILIPGVTGTTGIETKDIISGVKEIVNPDFIIIIDALKTSKTSRINQTIQISNSGISPGSGVGNHRSPLTKDSLNIPVVSIGVPTIIDSVTIVIDTLNYILKKISYDKNNLNNPKNKMKISKDYEYYEKELTDKEKEKILGLIGTLDDDNLKRLLNEVLNPLDYNFMVTPKEIDFLIDKMSLLLSEGINKALHKIKRQN